MASGEYSIIIPCFNEEGAIRQTVASIRAAVGDGGGCRLIVVNDGSSDRSAEILKEMSGEDPALMVVHHARNRGYGAALKTGIQHARTDFIVITDADGTYPNERIPELVGIAQGADMVVGARIGGDVVYPLIRKIPKAFLRRYVSWLARQTVPDMNSGLRVIRRSVVERFLRVLPDTFSFTTTLTLAMHTNAFDVRYVPIGYAARVGKSKIKPIRDTLNFIQLIVRTGTYFAPMRVFFPMSVVLFLAFTISLIYDVFLLENLADKTVLLFLFAVNTGMFALLADMIDKRSA
jgi:glycosyltransferase involved in cell wall biosynthesis